MNLYLPPRHRRCRTDRTALIAIMEMALIVNKHATDVLRRDYFVNYKGDTDFDYILRIIVFFVKIIYKFVVD